jgi:hypothetical protein
MSGLPHPGRYLFIGQFGAPPQKQSGFSLAALRPRKTGSIFTIKAKDICQKKQTLKEAIR